MKKRKTTGIIKGCGLLDNVPAELVKRQNAGGSLVKLLEARGAYKAGDLVQVGTGEFIPEQVRIDLNTGLPMK